jgi:hypothetical protein
MVLEMKGYLSWISEDFHYISLMDIWLGHLWISFGYLEWISFLVYLWKILYFAQRYPRDILSYPTISNDIQ